MIPIRDSELNLSPTPATRKMQNAEIFLSPIREKSTLYIVLFY